MSYATSARTAMRRPRSTTLAALAVLVGVLVGMVGCSSTTGPSSQPGSVESRTTTGGRAQDAGLLGNVPGELPHVAQSGGLTAADGEVAAGTSVFADVPAVAHLDPALRAALREAATDAAASGVELDVNSGWRSRSYQEQLFGEAVAAYGSEQSAERWVARPGSSVHEAGDAVDIGPASAATWLAGHGAAFGLCRIYDNEPWHFELRPGAVADGCPATYADPTHDPRLQQ